VDELSTMETRDIAVYLNFDMLASPNHVPWVYDDSTAPEGSDRITDLFMRLLDDQGVQGELLDLQGRSDHMRFEQEGIPIGGLFSGAEENKTMEQSEAYGGAAGKPFDSCYHQPCDDIGNIDENALAGLADAAAAALATLADRADEILEGVSR
jgi:Zn-dependent M28 family amino/carboxypeptidase